MFNQEELGVTHKVLTEFKGDGAAVVYAYGILTKLLSISTSLKEVSPSPLQFSPEEAGFLLKLIQAYVEFPIHVAPHLSGLVTKLRSINEPVPDEKEVTSGS